MATYKLTVNDRPVTVDSWDPDQPLLYVLRNQLDLHGPKFGCGLGQCGACSVLIDGKLAVSCQTTVQSVAGHSVTTVEHLGTPSKPSPIQQAFIAEQAAQCGYCTSGMVIAATALLKSNPHPTIDQAKTVLARNLCRCGTHTRILNAVMSVAKSKEAV
jgi:nicotinate dehydrogenase subunit A